MIDHCTCNLNLICAGYVIGSRSNNSLLAVYALSFNNVRLGCLHTMYNIILDYSTVTIVIGFIFHFSNINKSFYFVIIVLIPYPVEVSVSDIMTFVGTLRKMYNKSKEFVQLVVDNKVLRHLYNVVSFGCSGPFICKSI